MLLGIALFFFGLATPHSREVSWGRVADLFSSDEAKAYPHRILDAHEMANDVVGGRPVSLTYCTLCGSGVLYAGGHPSRAGQPPFTFGSSGLLYRSNKLMYDGPTNSLWNQLTSEPVAGRLADSGVRLERLPVVVTTWGEWKNKRPETGESAGAQVSARAVPAGRVQRFFDWTRNPFSREISLPRGAEELERLTKGGAP